MKRSRVSATVFLGLLLVSASYSVNYYYVNFYLPRNTDSDNDGWMDWDETHTYQTDPLTPNPNAKYFLSKGGAVELLNKITVLDADGKTNPQRRTFIDYLFSANLSKLPSGQLAQVRTQWIDQILKDGRVTSEEADALRLFSKYSLETQQRYTDISEDLVKYLHSLTLVNNRGFADYAIQNKLRMENGTLTDLDIKFLLEPEKYARNVFEADLKKLAVVRPDVAVELKKIPDFETIGMKEVEANEDIVYRILRANADEHGVFNIMLKEGIPEKRKYCSPLQALVWYAGGNEFDGQDPIVDMASKTDLITKGRMYQFIDDVWKRTYATSKWKDFRVVVDRLNSPKLVSAFMKNSIAYDYEAFEQYKRTGIRPRIGTPEQTFLSKKGMCNEQAWFAHHALSGNGYVYDDFDSRTTGASCILRLNDPLGSRGHEGHAVCLYKDDGEFYIINNGIIQGPYSSVQTAANAAFSSWKTYYFLKDFS